MTEQVLAEEEPHFCTNCGSPINSTDKFCTNCGAAIQRGSVAASDSGEAQASADGNSEQAGAYGEAQAAQPVEPVASTDATPVAAAVPAPVVAAAEVTSAVEQAVSEAEQAANTAQPTMSAAVAVKKPHKKAGAIATAIVGILVIASMLIILGLMQLNVLANPFAKARPVTFAIKAPHYNEKTDSKIPLHITGKTVSGKVISQHVYVSPKAPVVHLDPGVYKVQVEASPLMSSGEFYKTPAPLTVDTRSANAVVSTAQPAKPQLSFEVKPANEVTQQDIALAEKFAKKTGLSDNQLKEVKSKTSIHRIAQLYREIIKNPDKIDFESDYHDPRGSLEKIEYSLEDINGDGIPDLLMAAFYEDYGFASWDLIRPYVASPTEMKVQEVPSSLLGGYPANVEFRVMGSKSGNGLYRAIIASEVNTLTHFAFNDLSIITPNYFDTSGSTENVDSSDMKKLHFYKLTDDSPIAQFEKEATQAETSNTHSSEKGDSEPSKSTADSKPTDQKDSHSESNSGKKKAQSSQSEAKKKSDSHSSQNQKRSKASNEEKKKSSDKKSR